MSINQDLLFASSSTLLNKSDRGRIVFIVTARMPRVEEVIIFPPSLDSDGTARRKFHASPSVSSLMVNSILIHVIDLSAETAGAHMSPFYAQKYRKRSKRIKKDRKPKIAIIRSLRKVSPYFSDSRFRLSFLHTVGVTGSNPVSPTDLSSKRLPHAPPDWSGGEGVVNINKNNSEGRLGRGFTRNANLFGSPLIGQGR